MAVCFYGLQIKMQQLSKVSLSTGSAARASCVGRTSTLIRLVYSIILQCAAVCLDTRKTTVHFAVCSSSGSEGITDQSESELATVSPETIHGR